LGLGAGGGGGLGEAVVAADDDIVGDDDGVTVVGVSVDGPRESRERSRTADTRMAMTATPIAQKASIAALERCQEVGSPVDGIAEDVKSYGSS
jgi:regulator of RNase E activity RraA